MVDERELLDRIDRQLPDLDQAGVLTLRLANELAGLLDKARWLVVESVERLERGK